MVYFFQTDVLFSNLGYFAVNLRIFWCTFTGLNNAVVYQNWEIWGMSPSCRGGQGVPCSEVLEPLPERTFLRGSCHPPSRTQLPAFQNNGAWCSLNYHQNLYWPNFIFKFEVLKRINMNNLKSYWLGSNRINSQECLSFSCVKLLWTSFFAPKIF